LLILTHGNPKTSILPHPHKSNPLILTPRHVGLKRCGDVKVQIAYVCLAVLNLIPKIVILAGLAYHGDAVFKCGSFSFEGLSRFHTDFAAPLSFGN
jgi:hypothetical protein